MKSHPWSRITLLAVVAFALASCGKTSSLQSPAAGGSTSAESNEAQIARALQDSPELVQEDLTTSSAPLEADASGSFAAIRPFRFWREIRDVQTELSTEFLNPDPNGRPLLALVTIHRALSGAFYVAGVTESDTTRTLVRKPLHDHWTRRIALVRQPVPNDTVLTRWRLAGTSGVEVRTRDGATRIVSLHLQTAGLDTVVTDPLELHRLRRVLRFAPGTEVRLTVTTLAPDDVVLFRGADLRRRFVNNGDGTHSFRFPSGEFTGLRHFAVDALSHGTLFDDQAAYDSNAWALAYAVGQYRMPADR
jgi:hypothetical protein